MIEVEAGDIPELSDLITGPKGLRQALLDAGGGPW